MAYQKFQRAPGEAWRLAGRQHGVLTREQLLRLGYSAPAIVHRIKQARLHPVHRGVYAVGRADLSDLGRFIAAVLACGPGAVLSHEAAAALWSILRRPCEMVEVSVPSEVSRRRPGLTVHRRANLRTRDVTRRHGIPVTTPACTIVDLAARLDRDPLEALINEADSRRVVTVPALRRKLEEMPRRPGLRTLRRLLDIRTFRFTRSELERAFLPIARRAGLPRPQTRCWVNGFEVDFYWSGLGLVVETDGLGYHRTPAQQTRDRLRDQTHTAAGLTPLRFTHGQIRFESRRVEEVLDVVGRRLAGVG